MKCQDIKSKLELYIDNELNLEERAEFEHHLSICSNCLSELQLLKSIDSLGKVEVFSEPEPTYWNDLNQSIMEQIGGHEEKLAWIPNVIEKLKRIILPEKISYRLVGLAATAVIVFFIVRISFFRQGQFEIPIEIGSEDSIKISKQTSPALTIHEEANIEKELPKRESRPQIARSTNDKNFALPKASDSKSKIQIPETAMQEEPRTVPSVSEQAEITKEKDLFFHKSTAPTRDRAVQADKKERSNEFKLQQIATPAQEFKGSRFSATTIDNSSSYAVTDTSLHHYQKVFQSIQSVSNIDEKIEIWEKYLQINPADQMAKIAKHELAGLYYQQVEENPNQKNINQALNFYQDNSQLLFSMSDSIQFKKQFEVLQQLAQKIKKNE